MRFLIVTAVMAAGLAGPAAACVFACVRVCVCFPSRLLDPLVAVKVNKKRENRTKKKKMATPVSCVLVLLPVEHPHLQLELAQGISIVELFLRTPPFKTGDEMEVTAKKRHSRNKPDLQVPHVLVHRRVGRKGT